jgi:hypothetical protein
MKTRMLIAGFVVLGMCGLAQAGFIEGYSGLLYHLDAGAGVSTSGSTSIPYWGPGQSETADDTLSGPVVTVWADQSGNGNNFATTAGSPVLLASDPRFNNNPSVCGTGWHDSIQLATATTPMSLFIVEAAQQIGPAGRNLWGDPMSFKGIRGSYLTTNVWRVNGTGYEGAGNGDEWATSMYINGVATNAQTVFAPAILEAYGSATLTKTALWDYLDMGAHGAVAEVIAFDRVLTTTEAGEIRTYLSDKYTNVVPEPSSVVLAFLGVIGLVAYAWRKRK